jgi:hypothetical protein
MWTASVVGPRRFQRPSLPASPSIAVRAGENYLLVTSDRNEHLPVKWHA